MPRESATFRELNPDEATWGLIEHLLAGAIDTLRVANYQRAGGKGDRPRPIRRPGVAERDQQIAGGAGLSVADFNDRWNRVQQHSTDTAEGGD